jgi:hypothetical protein
MMFCSQGIRRVLAFTIFCLTVFWIGPGPGVLDRVSFADRTIQAVRDTLNPDAVTFSQPGSNQDEPRVRFSRTVAPEPALIFHLQALLAPFFDRPINLAVLLQKIISESAAVELSDGGRVLYNPAHMLLFHLPVDWRAAGNIKVATIEGVARTLKMDGPANPVIGAYAQGFETFTLLSQLMKLTDTREQLEPIWNAVQNSIEGKEALRYLLLRPLEQTAAIRDQPPACQRTINAFVDDVREGKRKAVPSLAGLTNILEPTKFVRQDDRIFFVLSERLIARYYVLAEFEISGDDCKISWERPIFAM